MGDLESGNLIDVRADVKTVAGETEHHVRKAFANEAQCLHGLKWIGERIAWTGDAHHLDCRNLLDHIFKIGESLHGG